MIKIKQFITFLGTDDLNKTAKFYINKLNFQLYKDQGLCQIYSITDTCKIGFCSHMKILNEPKNPILTIVTENVDHTYESFLRLDIEISQPPQLNPKFNIYHFFIRDPNGYTIEIQKFLD